MSEMNEVFRRREREIAATVANDAGLAARLDTAAMRRRRGRQAVVAASSIAVVGAVIGGVLLLMPAQKNDPVAPIESQSPSAAASSLETPTPTASETPTPQAVVVDGFAPVPQLPAEQIPWEEVGPGWFLVDYHVPLSASGSQLEDPYEMQPTGEATGGLSLLGPDGTWYAARSFAGTGAGFAVAWDGTNVWLADEAASGPDSAVASASLMNLESGADAGRVTNVPYEHFVGIDDGRALVFGFVGDGTASFVDGPAAGNALACSHLGAPIYGPVQDDWSFQYRPDSGGAMVCFVPRADERTDVTVLDVASPEGSMTISTLKSSAIRYVFLGWINGRSFIFGKTKEDGGAGFEQLFTYNLDTDEISPIDVPELRGFGDAYTYGYFDRQSQRFVVPTKSNGSWSVHLAKLDGTAVATVSGDCPSWADFMASGERLVVSCGSSGHVWLYSLLDGSQVSEWEVGGSGKAEFFDFPEQ